MEQLHQIYETLGAHTLPAWEELPDFELYMDQVLSLVGRYLWKLPDSGERPLTASMVNNYVKLKVLPPPVRKRYDRTHVARLLMICILKPVLPISDIQLLLEPLGEEEAVEAFYRRFCALYAQANGELVQAAAQTDAADADLILQAALRSQAQQNAALSLLAAGIEDEP